MVKGSKEFKVNCVFRFSRMPALIAVILLMIVFVNEFGWIVGACLTGVAGSFLVLITRWLRTHWFVCFQEDSVVIGNGVNKESVVTLQTITHCARIPNEEDYVWGVYTSDGRCIQLPMTEKFASVVRRLRQQAKANEALHVHGRHTQQSIGHE